MTLQNGLLTPDAAYLWSETALYSWDGKQLAGHQDKIFGGAGVPWAFIHSGTSDVAEEIEDDICQAQPMTLAALIPCLHSSLQRHRGHEWPGGQRVLIAAYENGPQLVVIGTKELAGYPPLAPIPIRPKMISSDSEAIRREVAKGVTVESMGRIIRQQHADCLMEGHWPLAGKVTRTRVSREGVEFAVVDDLPDPMALARAV